MTNQQEVLNPALYSRYIKGKTDCFHLYMTTNSKLLQELKILAAKSGKGTNLYIVDILYKHVKNNTREVHKK